MKNRVFHEGEICIQEKADERDLAIQNSQMINDVIPKAVWEYIENQSLAYLGSIDSDEFPWACQIVCKGAIRVIENGKKVLLSKDKIWHEDNEQFLQNINNNPKIGLLLFDSEKRRRYRINGRISQHNEYYEITVLEANPNCPQYIQRRKLISIHKDLAKDIPSKIKFHTFTEQIEKILRSIDTFIVSSCNPNGEVDISHRGGKAGFILVKDNRTLRIPDYSGNGLFNTLGNFKINPKAGLFIQDYDTGILLHLIGTVTINFNDDDVEVNTGGTGRFWDFRLENGVLSSSQTRLIWKYIDSWPHNP